MSMTKMVMVLILMLAVTGMMSMHAYGQSIPPQMKIIAKMWVDGLISDADYLKALQSMVDSGLLKGQKSSASPGTDNAKQTANTDTGKLFLLLPQKSDLGPEWTVKKAADYNKATKSFYYENAGQVNYNKDVHTIKDYRMHLFKFSDSKSAQDAYDRKYVNMKRDVGHWEQWDKDASKTKQSKFTLSYPDKLIMDSQSCIAVRYSVYGDLDQIYGYCLVKNYLIYEDITGYYPDMKSDFIRMMDIAKGKVSK